MSDRQIKFAKELSRSSSAKEAAIRAGYSPRCAAVAAAKLKSKPQVRRTIDEINERVIVKAATTKADMIKRFKEISIRAEQLENPQLAASVKAWENIGRALGYFEPEKQTPQSYNVTITVPREEAEDVQV